MCGGAKAHSLLHDMKRNETNTNQHSCCCEIVFWSFFLFGFEKVPVRTFDGSVFCWSGLADRPRLSATGVISQWLSVVLKGELHCHGMGRKTCCVMVSGLLRLWSWFED